jgi:hypothetical protein
MIKYTYIFLRGEKTIKFLGESNLHIHKNQSESSFALNQLLTIRSPRFMIRIKGYIMRHFHIFKSYTAINRLKISDDDVVNFVLTICVDFHLSLNNSFCFFTYDHKNKYFHISVLDYTPPENKINSRLYAKICSKNEFTVHTVTKTILRVSV